MSFPQTAFNPAVRALTAPPIPTVQAWATNYGGHAGPLIDLSQAVPGYPPHPSLLKDIATLAHDRTLAGYGDIEGEPALRAAFAHYTSMQLGTSLEANNVQITSGCNQAFVVSMLTLAGRGDRVLLTNPCFFNNEAALAMLGLEPRFVTCAPENGFIPKPEDVARAIDNDDIRVVALVSPNNPTGAVYPRETLADIQRICLERGVWLVIDETYADFIGGNNAPRHDLLTTSEWENNTVLLYSFSKVYCTPGLRVGAITGGADVIVETTKVMDNLQICAPRHAQSALANALPALGDWRQGNSHEIEQRAEAFRSTIATCAGWKIMAVGAYFAYVKHPFSDTPSMDVAAHMAQDAGVLCLPGMFFGEDQDNYLRIAFANADVGEIAELGNRLKRLTATR